MVVLIVVLVPEVVIVSFAIAIVLCLLLGGPALLWSSISQAEIFNVELK